MSSKTWACCSLPSYQCARMFSGGTDMLLPSVPNICHSSIAQPWCLDYCNAILVGLPASTLAPFQWVLHAAASTVLDLKPCDCVTPALQELHWLSVAERSQFKLCLLVHKSLLGHTGIHLGPSDNGCWNSGLIYTTCLITWQPCCAADMSVNRQQSFFCCWTASVKQAADRAETPVINGLISSWSENISNWYSLLAPGYRQILWCALGLLVEGALQVPQL